MANSLTPSFAVFSSPAPAQQLQREFGDRVVRTVQEILDGSDLVPVGAHLVGDAGQETVGLAQHP